MKPVERVKDIIKYKRISVSAFEKITGMSNNSIQIALKRNSNLKDETLNNILKTYPDINPTWLLTGKGEMTLTEELTDTILDIENIRMLKEIKGLNKEDQERILITIDALIKDAQSRK